MLYKSLLHFVNWSLGDNGFIQMKTDLNRVGKLSFLSVAPSQYGLFILVDVVKLMVQWSLTLSWIRRRRLLISLSNEWPLHCLASFFHAVNDNVILLLSTSFPAKCYKCIPYHFALNAISVAALFTKHFNGRFVLLAVYSSPFLFPNIRRVTQM